MTTETPVAGLTTRPATGTTWKLAGLCTQVDPELFFPSSGQPTDEAERVCTGCNVRELCLEYALEHGERGIWGGKTENERRRILRKRKGAPVQMADYAKASRDRTIWRLTTEGYSAAEIADLVGCTQRTVTRVRVAARQEAA